MAVSIDRAHRVQKQHGCSPIYDADAYPGRSVRHRTACAESWHAINKAFKTHLLHLRQDHFMVQMRLLGGFVNLRMKMRHAFGKAKNHRRACSLFHEHLQTHCDRRFCSYAHGRRKGAEEEASTAAAAVLAAAAVPAAAAAPDAGAAAEVDAAAALAVPAPGDAARGLFRAIEDAVAAAVTPAAQAAVANALSDAAREAAALVAVRLGEAAGQAAVVAAHRVANVSGD